MPDAGPHTGRCYCGTTKLDAQALPQQVAICHCVDCRRVTGAAVAAFAAFDVDQITITPDPGAGFEGAPGVRRWFCQHCGSPLAAMFDYLPGQIYVPVGILDFVADLTPDLHCHSAAMLPWLKDMDRLPQHQQSARIHLHQDRDKT